MDIGAMSIGMHQASLESAVSISVMKMAMNKGIEEATQMTEIMKNSAVDPNLGNNLDVSV